MLPLHLLSHTVWVQTQQICTVGVWTDHGNKNNNVPASVCDLAVCFKNICGICTFSILAILDSSTDFQLYSLCLLKKQNKKLATQLESIKENFVKLHCTFDYMSI